MTDRWRDFTFDPNQLQPPFSVSVNRTAVCVSVCQRDTFFRLIFFLLPATCDRESVWGGWINHYRHG